MADGHKYVAVVGNLSDGFAAYGPFDTFDDAAGWADGMLDAWIMTVEPPTKQDKKETT